MRDALNQYLDSKIVPLRQKRENEKVQSTGDDKSDCSITTDSELGKEWRIMVEGIALFFDQALKVHLLFPEERSQYNCLRRQILAQRRQSTSRSSKSNSKLDEVSSNSKVERCDSLQSATTDSSSFVALKPLSISTEGIKTLSIERPDSALSTTTVDNNTTTSEALNSVSNVKFQPPSILLPERLSEIYGCEYLLRLFVRLPGVVAESAISETQSRRIFSKLGDLTRFLQKHQGELFCSSFRRPLPNENRGKKVAGDLDK